MKNFYILIFAVLFTNLSFGQNMNSDMLQPEMQDYTNKILNQNTDSKSSSQLPVIIWSEDFDLGFPLGWSTHSVNTQGGQATCPWAWTTDGTWGYWNTNNATSPSNELTSTTASNGFLISDTDSANHFSYGQPSGTTYEYIESYFTTNSIDLSLHPAVSLEFEHLFRYNNLGNTSFTPPTVYVSSDSINWTPFLVNGGIANNTQSNNPESEIINITSVAGSQSTVYLRFGWVSRCYYWMVDDINLIKTPDHQLICTDEVIGGWWLGYQGPAGGLGQDYSFYPLSQASANPYTFECVLKNNGAITQSATLKVEVEDGSGTNLFSGSSVALVLASGEQDTIAAATQFTPTAIGSYTAIMYAESDSAGAGIIMNYTDTSTKMSVVTEHIYGKDFNLSDGSWRLNRINPQPGGFEVSSNYDIYSDVDLYSVDVHVSDWSIPGANIYVAIYEEDVDPANDPILLDQSDDYTITQADLGAWVTIPFISPQTLTSATKMYRISVGANLHPTDSVGVDVSGDGAFSADGLLDKDAILTNSTSGPRWYTIGDIPMLRMNFNPISTAIDIIKENIFNVYPNPTNGLITIEIEDALKYELLIFNVLGQSVYTNLISGINNKIDLSPLDKGVYTIELKGGGNVYSEKVILE